MTFAAEERVNCLRRLRITEEEAVALELVWSGLALRHIADARTTFLADAGYDALTTLDTIWHELDGDIAHTYMLHGLTPHQSFLIEESAHAQHNLWGPEQDTERGYEVLASRLDPDVLAAILLEADSPDEADSLVAYYTKDERDSTREHEQAAQRIMDILGTENGRRAHTCDCR